MSHRGYIVNFGRQDRVRILNWLMVYLMDDQWQMSPNNTSCIKYDAQGMRVYRWRMALKKSDTRVMMDLEEDVQLFVLAWGGTVIDLNKTTV